MVCPNCQSANIKVVDTIHGVKNEIHRRRRCIDCNFVFRSIEVIDRFGMVFEKEYYQALKNKKNGEAQC